MKSFRAFSLFVFIFSLAHCASADERIKTALAPYVERGEMPGYVSVLIDGEREDWTLDGWSDVGRREPMKKDTLFRICSQTKGVVGTAVAKLVAEGRLSLDDDLSRYLPEYAGKGITLRHCLSHTAGFPFQTAVSKALGWTSTPPRVAAAVAATEPLAYKTGEKWLYSNAGIDVAVAVVEVATGERIQDHLKRVLFDPLGMKDTTFFPSAEQQQRLATIYNVATGEVARVMKQYRSLPEPYDSPDRYPSGGAGLFSTPRDMAEFYRMLAFGGVARDGRRVIPEEAVTGILAVKQTPANMTSYSLGLFVEGDTIWHDGALKTVGYANPKKRQVRLWMMQADYGKPGQNRWHQHNVWKPAADEFFKATIGTSGEGLTP